ncbi:MAG: hypothetical protein R6X02_35315 [Enhygromyxa sp.]
MRVRTDVGLFAAGALALACAQPASTAADSGLSTGETSETASDTSEGLESEDEGESEDESEGEGESEGEDEAEAETDTDEPRCRKNVVLMGYWPPTNEMLRPWSTNPSQNPGGWIGGDWEGYGFDVYAFFPEFPPDGDPSNDPIGSSGAVGSPDFDLRVDYQATSSDFWRIVDEHAPVILITTSRGGGIGWEIEAIEGGHGLDNPGDPAFDWASDQHGPDTRPTQDSIEPRSWDAIATWRQGDTLASSLPMAAIHEATSALGLTSVQIDQVGTSGNFLSGFLGLHGVYHALHERQVVAAGHIHVGYGLPVDDASALMAETLRVVLEEHPADGVGCSPGW